MKTKLIYLFSLLCLLVTSCNDDDPVFNLSQQDFTEIPCEGADLTVYVESEGAWSAKSMDAWIVVTDEGQAGRSTLQVRIDGNLEAGSRTGRVVIAANGGERTLTFTQKGKPAEEELAYRIPLIFHVLYSDPADPVQNIPTDYIYQILNNVNYLYGKQENIKLEFIPAIVDPSGNKLSEPGINRVKWVESPIDPTVVMQDDNTEYLHLLWDPNKYVNVLLYNFSVQNILGISTFPLTPKSNPLVGMEPVEDMNLTLENLTKMRCVSLNSMWIMYTSRDYLEGYVPDELLMLQSNPSITLAHELGHYFGLRHVFAESPNGACVDTDHCEDTYSYDKQAYDMDVQYYWEEKDFNPNFDNEFNWEVVFKRTSCKEGIEFTSKNLMDYAYGFLEEFTPQQCARMRHVLNYSPLIPGPKKTRSGLTRSVQGPIDLPHEVAICERIQPLHK